MDADHRPTPSTGAGLPIQEFRPCGFGRYPSGVFLVFWLCSWAAGEAFAIWMLVHGAISLVSGRPPGPGHEPLEYGGAILAGAFLLCWLALWTVGGIAAIGELLRLFGATDRVMCPPGVLIVEQQRGPFRSFREIRSADIQAVTLSEYSGVRVETPTRPIEVTRLGTREEREALTEALRRHCRVAESGQVPGLPEEWQEVITPDGGAALVSNETTRGQQVVVAGVVTGAAMLVGTALTHVAFQRPGASIPAAVTWAISMLLAWGTIWLRYGRIEWRLLPGSIIVSRRFLDSTTDLLIGHRLELSVRSDSDGDAWYHLDLVADPCMSLPSAHGSSPRRRKLAQAFRDPWTPRSLARWLAARTGIPFDDVAGAEQSSIGLAGRKALS